MILFTVSLVLPHFSCINVSSNYLLKIYLDQDRVRIRKNLVSSLVIKSIPRRDPVPVRLVLRGKEGVLLRQVAEDIREHSGPLPQGDSDDDDDNNDDNDDDDDAQGELHLTESVCPKDFVGELQYWGLSALYLEPCCAYTLQVSCDWWPGGHVTSVLTLIGSHPAARLLAPPRGGPRRR